MNPIITCEVDVPWPVTSPRKHGIIWQACLIIYIMSLKQHATGRRIFSPLFKEETSAVLHLKHSTVWC
jgi:hypothetical protein